MNVRPVSLLVCLLAALAVAYGSGVTTSTSDCAIDCRPFGVNQGSVQIPTIGAIGGAATFKIDYMLRDWQSGNELFFVGGYDPTYLRLLNNPPRYQFIRNAQIISSPIPNFQRRQWYTVMVVVDANGLGTIYHYEPGTATFVTLSSTVSVGALGCAYRAASICSTWNGLVDNFAMWNAAKPPSYIQTFPNTPTLTAEDQKDLLFNALMDECRDALTVPVTPDTRTQLLQSTLQNAMFATKVNDMMRCHGSGDPHYYSWFWDSLDPSLHGVEWAPFNYYMTGTYTLASCRSTFEARTFQRYVSWWPSAAVIRKTSIRAFDHFFLLSEDEPDQAQGAFHKWAPEQPWVALPTGTYYDRNGVYHSWDGTTLTVIVPNVGYMAAIQRWHQQVDLYLDASYCSKANRPAMGICDRNATVAKNIDFRDVTFGSDPEDPRPIDPKADPCNGDAALIAIADKVCLKLHPGGITNAQFNACRFDVCVTGDPDTPITGGGEPSCILQDWLNSHPRTVQNNPAAPLATQTTCEPCPNFCSFHGTCNVTGRSCVCEAGWTGRDCGLPVGFDCYKAQSYPIGTSATAAHPIRNVQPLVALTGNVDLNLFLAPYTVEDSILVYPLSQRAGADWSASSDLSIVVVAGSANSAGSATLNLNFGFAVTPANILKSRPQGVTATAADASWTISGNSVALRLTWNFAPITVRFSKMPASYILKASLASGASGVTQLLVGSGVEARTQMDVIRVPLSHEVSITGDQCTSDPCAQINSCEACAANSQCGFCVESGRCMRGDSFGPLRGTCANWRFSFDPKVSRRVTSQFGFPVNPVKAEVFLTNFIGDDNAADRALPVDLSVSAVDLGNVWDVLVMVHPRTPSSGVAATSAWLAKVRGSLETQLVPSLLDTKLYPEIGLAIATHGNGVRLVRDFTEVRQDTLFLFGGQIQTITNMAAETGSNQVNSLFAIVPETGAAPKWRKNARRLVVITADMAPTLVQADVNKMRAAMITHRIFPVVLINRDSCDAACRSTWDTFLTNPNTGLGFGFSLQFDKDYNEFAPAVRKAIRLATGQISLTYDRARSGHINTAEVQGETLQVYGLTRNFRGRFAVPFQRFSSVDNSMLTATITAVGFGQATVEDIVTERPSTDDIVRNSYQDEPDFYFLQGRTFKNLLTTRPRILTIPAEGTLHDSLADGSRGEAITQAMLPYTVTHPSGKVWFVPVRYRHSAPDGRGGLQPYAQYTFTVHDGCSASDVKRVRHFVAPVNDPPGVIQTLPRDLITAEDTDLPFTVLLDDPDYQPVDNLRVVFNSLPSNGQVLFGGQVVTVGFAYPYNSRAYPFVFRPSPDWHGADSFNVLVRDDGTPRLERPAVIEVFVTPVNDAPSARSSIEYVSTKERVVAAIPLFGDDKDRIYSDFDNSTIYIQLIVPANFNGTLCRVNVSSCAPGDILNDGAMVPITADEAPLSERIFYKSPEAATAYSCPNNTFPGINCSTPYTSVSFQVVDGQMARSAIVTIPIYVLQVNDPPVVENIRQLRTKENITVSIVLSGQNMEYPGEPMIYVIQAFPQDVVFKRADGSIINEADPVVNADRFATPEVFLTPGTHLHGTPTTPAWLFGSFSYYAKDRFPTRSNIGTVEFFVEPVNDPPVPTFFTISMMEKQSTPFALTAIDIDSDASQFTFKVTQLNDRVKGQIFLLDTAAADLRGAEIDSVPVDVPRVSYNGSAPMPWLIYVPSGYDGFWYGNDSLTYTVTDTDKYGNSVVNTVSQQATINVAPVNDAPVINVQPFYMIEDTTDIITLAGIDPWFGENDPLQAIILRFYTPESSLGCRNKMGKLFQFSGDLANPKGAEITEFPATVTDSRFRIVYEPAPNTNNDNRVPHLFVEPVIDYVVNETSSHAIPEKLQSAFQSIPIVIAPRNDLPVVLGPQNNLIEACTDVCTFKKNFGRSFRETLGFAGIFFGGDDIEKGTVTPIITAIRSSSKTFKLFPIDDPSRLLTPESVDPQNPATWITIARSVDLVPPFGCNSTSPAPAFVQGLDFQPGLDEYNETSYLEIDYRVKDDQDGLSLDTKTIIIKIENTPLPPRADQFNQYIVAFQNTPRDFVIRAIDPDQQAFQMVVSSCTGEAQGRFQMLAEDGTVRADVPAISCPSNTRVVFPAVARDSTGYQNWRVRYTPPPNKTGKGVNMLTLSYDDGVAAAGLLDTYYVISDVQRENKAPSIRINNVVSDNVQADTVFQTGSTVAPVLIAITDPDISAASTTLFIKGNVTIDNEGDLIIQDQIVPGRAYAFEGTPSTVNNILSSLRVNASAGYKTYTIRVEVDDQANVGFCRVVGGEPAPCALRVQSSVDVVFSESPSSVNSVAVGSASAAAAAAAIVAAALLFRKVSQKPEDAYAPWEMDAGNDDGVVMNPLFESAGTEADNPLFEAPTPQ